MYSGEVLIFGLALAASLSLFSAEEKKLDAEVHRQHIFGLHVSNYMKLLEEEDNEAFKRQFSKYIALGVRADDVSGFVLFCFS